MKICGIITFINFICLTTISNKRKCQDDIVSNHNKDDTVDSKSTLDNQAPYFTLNKLEQYKDEQNEPKRSKYFDCDFIYEDLSEFLNFTEFQKYPQDKINDEQIEIMDLDDLSLNYDCKNSLTLEKKSDISKKASGYCTEVPKQIYNLERTDKKTEGVPNLNQNFSLAVGSPNDGDVYEHLNTFLNNIEILIFLNELLIAFKKYICNYISANTVTSYRSWHLKRINNLDRDFAVISKYKLDEKLYSDIYDPLYDKQLLNKLKNLNVDKLLNFNRETYKHVENNVFKGIFWTKKAGFVRERLSILSDDHKKAFFFHEFFKLYKFSIEIPELITLGSLNKEEKISKITFLLHIINLAAKTVDKIENIKVFILCMISIAFEISYDTKFNIFEIKNYYVSCAKNEHNLCITTLEFSIYKRNNIKCRKSKNLYLHEKDKFVVKTVILTLIFQHLLYMKFLIIINNSNIRDEKYIGLQDFILKVIKPNVCNGCLLDEFLEIIKNI